MQRRPSRARLRDDSGQVVDVIIEAHDAGALALAQPVAAMIGRDDGDAFPHKPFGHRCVSALCSANPCAMTTTPTGGASGCHLRTWIRRPRTPDKSCCPRPAHQRRGSSPSQREPSNATGGMCGFGATAWSVIPVQAPSRETLAANSPELVDRGPHYRASTTMFAATTKMKRRARADDDRKVLHLDRLDHGESEAW